MLLNLKIFWSQLPEKFWFWWAWRLPKKLVYFATIRLIAFATQGEYGNTVVSELPAMEAISRWERGLTKRERSPRTTRKANTMLKKILEQMYQDAFMRDKVPQKRRLPRGLHISLTCHSQGVTLIISRDDKYPSAQEWKAVINAFPYFTGSSNPAQIIDSDRRFALRAELPTRQKVAEQMKFA